MKKMILAFAMLLAGTGVPRLFAQSGNPVTFEVTNIPSEQGKVLLTTQNGEYYGIVDVTVPTTTIQLEGIPNGEYTVYVFHDANNNFTLDRDGEDIPVEYCATQQIEVTDARKTFQIKLENIRERMNH